MRDRWSFLVVSLVLDFFVVADNAYGAPQCDLLPGQTSVEADEFVYPVGDPNLKPIKRNCEPNGFAQEFVVVQEFAENDHIGVDLDTCGNGDPGPVHATAVGRVVYRQDSTTPDSMGHMIRIEHLLPNGQFIYSQYAHLKEGSIEVGCGVAVVASQVIGRVGGTGAEKIHLHFEIKKIDANGCGYFPSTICTGPDSLDNYIQPLNFIETKQEEGGFDFALDSLQVNGNIPGDFFDSFNDGHLDRLPTSEFDCFDTVKSESGGFLNLRSSDGANTFTPPFLVDNCQLGIVTGSTLLQDGEGDAVITASFRADPPVPGQAYGVQLVTLGGGENVNIQLGGSGAGTVVVGFVVQTGFVQTVPVDLTGVERILLRLEFQDSTNRVFPSFSINNGITFTPIALPPTATVFTPSGQNRAFVSLFGSVIAD